MLPVQRVQNDTETEIRHLANVRAVSQVRSQLRQRIVTVLFGRLGERQLHGAAVGVVSLAHAALVLLLVGADLLVAADVL